MTSKNQTDPKLTACIDDIRNYMLELYDSTEDVQLNSATSIRVSRSVSAIVRSLQELDFEAADAQIGNLSYFLIDSGDWSCPSCKTARKITKTVDSLVQAWKDGELVGVNTYEPPRSGPLSDRAFSMLSYASFVLGLIFAVIIAAVVR